MFSEFSAILHRKASHNIIIGPSSTLFDSYIMQDLSLNHSLFSLKFPGLFIRNFSPTFLLPLSCYCEIIFMRWTFNLMYFVGRTFHKLKISMKYIFPSVIFHKIWKTQIYVSRNMSIIVKPRNLVPTKWNNFTVKKDTVYWLKYSFC